MATITLRSILVRRVLIGLEVAVFLWLAFGVVQSYRADRWGQSVILADLRRATQLDAHNSEHFLRLGRQEQYNITEMNSELALAHFRHATELNPRDPAPWLELSAAYNFQGQAAEAEACLRRADWLAPNLPHIQWVIGNFFLLQGNTDEAFRHFKVVLAGTPGYNQILFRTAWKASEDGVKILNELIPARVPTETDYLYFLLREKRFREAQAVWRRLASGSEAFEPAQVAGYVDQLILAHLPAEAAQVWDDLHARGLIKPTYQPTPQNMLVNGDFEEDILNMGFDWRIAPVDGVLTAIDSTNFHSPSRSLQITFLGKTNLEYRGVYQYVRVEPGRSYRLQGFLRTDAITTESGPRLEVRDAYDSLALEQFSESLTGTSPGWSQAILDFTAGPKTELVVVGVARLPSRKLDNLIAGKVWVDDVRLTSGR